MKTVSLEDLLEKTSRTFALSIPVLPEPTRREVMIAYLLFRIADTFEDASHWTPDDRIGALADFNGLLRSDSREKAEVLCRDWVGREVAHHAGYQELMAEVPFVLDAFFALSPRAIPPIREHVIRSADGMASIVAKTRGGELTLHSIRELQDYCYIVAGIVGEMLTELFLLGRPNLAGPDGTSIVAMPSLERVTAELTACGFDVEILASTRRPPRHFFTLSATRISREDPIP